jgi:hypothetical protein
LNTQYRFAQRQDSRALHCLVTYCNIHSIRAPRLNEGRIRHTCRTQHYAFVRRPRMCAASAKGPLRARPYQTAVTVVVSSTIVASGSSFSTRLRARLLLPFWLLRLVQHMNIVTRTMRDRAVAKTRTAVRIEWNDSASHWSWNASVTLSNTSTVTRVPFPTSATRIASPPVATRGRGL